MVLHHGIPLAWPVIWTVLELLAMLVLIYLQGTCTRNGCRRFCCRVVQRAYHLPRLSWRLGATWLATSVLLTLIGLCSKFIRFRPWSPLTAHDLALLVRCLVMPGLVEEIVFRCLLVPLPPDLEPPTPDSEQSDESSSDSSGSESDSSGAERDTSDLALAPKATPGRPSKRLAHERRSRCLWTASELAALVIFVTYHLDQLHSLPSNGLPKGVFSDLRFLALAAVLGAGCNEAIRLSGSLWMATAWHGTWVWIWLIRFEFVVDDAHAE